MPYLLNFAPVVPPDWLDPEDALVFETGEGAEIYAAEPYLQETYDKIQPRSFEGKSTVINYVWTNDTVFWAVVKYFNNGVEAHAHKRHLVCLARVEPEQRDEAHSFLLSCFMASGAPLQQSWKQTSEGENVTISLPVRPN